MTELPIGYENAVSVSGQGLRQMLEAPLGEGAADRQAMIPTAPGGTYTVTVAAGVCYVRGDSVGGQGLYRCENDAAKDTSAFNAGALVAANGTNPRLDQIIARVYDHDADGSGQRKWQLEVLTGVATAGATLDNRNGAATPPASAMLICDILVPAGATTLAAGDIRDRRPYAGAMVAPALFAGTNQQPLFPMPPLGVRPALIDATSHNNMQAAAPFVIPRRMNSVTRLRWRYGQGATALTGNYNIGIYDASGRLIVSTGALAFAGAAGVFTTKADTLASTNFEGGTYWVVIGLASLAGGAATVHGVSLATRTAVLGTDPQPVQIGVPAVNYGARNATGGTTLPTTVLSMTSISGLTAATEAPPVPAATIAVV